MAAKRAFHLVCGSLLRTPFINPSACFPTKTMSRTFHAASPLYGRDNRSLETQKQLMLKSSGIFDELAAKKTADKATFNKAVQMYIAKESMYRRGHVEFIYAAMQNMERFGVHRDLTMYKALLEIFPKGKLAARTVWQIEWMHFPKQQQCAIDLMDQMEDYGVIPDHDFGMRLEKVFGTGAHAFRKYQRMMYWMPKFKNANPYPVQKDLPDDPVQLALLALRRMSVDRDTKFSVWQGPDIVSETQEETFIASAQSVTQQELISKHDPKTPLFVEGGYSCWLRHASTTYFILRADPDLAMIQLWQQADKNIDDNLFDWTLFWDSEEAAELTPLRSIHEQDDGTVLGMAVTGTSSKESLVSWIRCLQQNNPALEQIPIVFRLRTPETQVQVIGNKTADTKVQVSSPH